MLIAILWAWTDARGRMHSGLVLKMGLKSFALSNTPGGIQMLLNDGNPSPGPALSTYRSKENFHLGEVPPVPVFQRPYQMRVATPGDPFDFSAVTVAHWVVASLILLTWSILVLVRHRRVLRARRIEDLITNAPAS